jgi:Ran GTPase-activating protein (RanGAP) involved in mRNA processing and transport
LCISGSNDITEKALENISKTLKELKILKLSNLKRLTDRGIRWIAIGLKQLEVLEICNNYSVSESAMLDIPKKMKQLKELRISGCTRVTKEWFEQLRSILPTCHCIFDPYWGRVD